MAQNCELPIVRIGQQPDHETDCSKEAAARKIYAEVGPATVKITHGNVIGSGFFVGDGSRVVTNAHVVNGERGLFKVETIDHKTYKARLEKLDDVNDLAVIHLEDEQHHPATLKIGDDNKVKVGDALYALGHPLGKYDTYIAPGKFVTKGPFDQVFASKDPNDRDWRTFLATARNSNPAIAADAQAVIKSPRVEAELQIEPGNSGGPMVNERGEVVAVSQFGSESRQYHKYAWAVSSDEVIALLNNNAKFQFDYEKQSSLRAHPLGTPLAAAGLIGITAALPRVGGSLLGAISAIDMISLASGNSEPVKDDADRVYRGLEWTSDITMTAGAVMSWIPRLRPLAIAGYSIGLATGIGQAFVPHEMRLVNIQRTSNPQDTREPLFWQGVKSY